MTQNDNKDSMDSNTNCEQFRKIVLRDVEIKLRPMPIDRFLAEIERQLESTASSTEHTSARRSKFKKSRWRAKQRRKKEREKLISDLISVSSTRNECKISNIIEPISKFMGNVREELDLILPKVIVYPKWLAKPERLDRLSDHELLSLYIACIAVSELDQK